MSRFTVERHGKDDYVRGYMARSYDIQVDVLLVLGSSKERQWVLPFSLQAGQHHLIIELLDPYHIQNHTPTVVVSYLWKGASTFYWWMLVKSYWQRCKPKCLMFSALSQTNTLERATSRGCILTGRAIIDYGDVQGLQHFKNYGVLLTCLIF